MTKKSTNKNYQVNIESANLSLFGEIHLFQNKLGHLHESSRSKKVF